TKKASTTPRANMHSPNISGPSKHNRTIIITRDSTPVPATITPLINYDAVNVAMNKPLITKVCFTSTYNILLVAITSTSSDAILEFQLKLKEGIHNTIQSGHAI
ncbi:hypothetical protein RUND412_011150, partial [Rhizina undulata]